MAILTLPSDLTDSGVNQDSLITWMTNVNSIVNELKDDHATSKVGVDELVTLTTELRADHATFITEQTAIGTTLADYKAIYDAHTHLADGNAATVSLPDTSSPTGSPGSASAFTDTSGSPPATITAPVATAGPATLTNITDLTLLGG